MIVGALIFLTGTASGNLVVTHIMAKYTGYLILLLEIVPRNLLMLFAHLNWLSHALNFHEVVTTSIWWLRWGLVGVLGLQLPVRRKGLSSKEGFKLFFICCQGLMAYCYLWVQQWMLGWEKKHYCGMLLSRPWNFSLRCHWKMSLWRGNLSTQASWCSGSFICGNPV